MNDFVTPQERLDLQEMDDAAYLRTQRAGAVAWLRERGIYRGETGCGHRYTTAAGEQVAVDLKTMQPVTVEP